MLGIPADKQARGTIDKSVFINNLQDAKCEWFLDVINSIIDVKDLGINITDVYIRQDDAITFGILKSFLPAFHITYKPSMKDIEILIKTLLYLSYGAIHRTSTNDLMRMVEDQWKTKDAIYFSLAVDGFGIMRITFSKSIKGYVVTFRLLPFEVPNVDDVRAPEEMKAFLRDLFKAEVKMLVPTRMPQGKLEAKPVDSVIAKRGGLIIHCGTTGSGKSTSIAAEIDYMYTIGMQGITITYEEPVEYRFTMLPNVLQYEIDFNLKREDIYHHFLRSTAQVLMIGEVKTKQEIEMLVDIASRGHIVITTLHASSVLEALMILRSNVSDLGLLMSSLLAIIHQKLTFDVHGKILPLHEVLLFKDNSDFGKILKNALEKGDLTYQQLEASFKNEMNSNIPWDKRSYFPMSYYISLAKKQGLL